MIAKCCKKVYIYIFITSRCIAPPITDENHVVFVVLFDFLHEDLHEVGCSHAGPGADLAIQRVRHLLRLRVEGEDHFELTSMFAGESVLLRQLVVIWDYYLLGSSALRYWRLLPTIHVV